MPWLRCWWRSAGSPAPDFDLADLAGRRHTLGTLLEGRRALLVDFFYLDCAPCIAAFPVLERLGEAHAAHGLGIVAVDRGDKPSALRRFAEACARHTLILTAAEDDPIFFAYRVFAYPTTCLINAERHIAHRRWGGDAVALEAAVARLVRRNTS